MKYRSEIPRRISLALDHYSTVCIGEIVREMNGTKRVSKHGEDSGAPMRREIAAARRRVERAVVAALRTATVKS